MWLWTVFDIKFQRSCFINRSAESAAHDTEAIYAAASQKGCWKWVIRQGLHCLFVFFLVCKLMNMYISSSFVARIFIEVTLAVIWCWLFCDASCIPPSAVTLSKNVPTLASCSFDKRGLIVIILDWIASADFQKWYAYSTFLVPSLLLLFLFV